MAQKLEKLLATVQYKEDDPSSRELKSFRNEDDLLLFVGTMKKGVTISNVFKVDFEYNITKLEITFDGALTLEVVEYISNGGN